MTTMPARVFNFRARACLVLWGADGVDECDGAGGGGMAADGVLAGGGVLEAGEDECCDAVEPACLGRAACLTGAGCLAGAACLAGCLADAAGVEVVGGGGTATDGMEVVGGVTAAGVDAGARITWLAGVAFWGPLPITALSRTSRRTITAPPAPPTNARRRLFSRGDGRLGRRVVAVRARLLR